MSVVRLHAPVSGAGRRRAVAGSGGGAAAVKARHGAADPAGLACSWRLISGAPGVCDAIAHPDPTGARDACRGSLVIECRFDAALAAQRPLLRCRAPTGSGGGRARGVELALMADPDRGLGLFLRRDGRDFRAEAPWPQGGPPALLRLMFHWDDPASVWTLAAEDGAGGDVALASGAGAAGVSVADLCALISRGEVLRDGAVQWLAVAGARVPFGLGAHLEAEALVQTPGGHIAAEQLRAGDMVITRDRGAQPVRAAGVVEYPAQGANAPVTVRAHYLGAQIDLRLLARQRIALGGAEVEYLFGEDEVLVEAGYFVDDRTVIRAAPGGRMRLAYVLLDEPDLICANGCWIESLWHGAAAARPARLAASGLAHLAPAPAHAHTARRVLKPYEARTLAALRSQSGGVR
jgi:hypothetical protein